MSATDSESSIDWLATDNEDDGSEREEPEEPESSGRTQPPGGAGCGDTRDRDGAVCPKPPGRSSRGAHHGLKRALGSTDTGSRIVSTECQKNQAFSSKCKELQCYIHPLSTILHGLRSGRYRERLSSFQESVAMDRIQRIMGVLQNPCMGEKYVSIILKMEEMLKSWFPDVKTREQSSVPQAEQGAPSKKPKFSPAPPAVTHAPVRPVPASSTPALRVTDLTPPGAYSASTLKWLHTLPICSLGTEQGPTGPRRLPPPPLADPALTQDSAVSSSTDHGAATPPPAPTHPPAGKISAPCLERLLKSTQSIVACRGATSGWS